MRSIRNTPPSRLFVRGASATHARAEDPFFFFDKALRSVPPAQPASIFDGAHNVYLSPHHDDVCFSLGGLAAQQPGGRLINLFTRSGYSINPPAGPNPDVGVITRRRIEEDNSFAALCGLTKIDLGLTDAPLHGRKSMDLSRVQEDRSALKGPLLSCLRNIAVNAGQSPELTLFCPAGIGGHVNHVATMQTVIEALPILQRSYRVFFYEDLHYASSAQKRAQGLLRLFAALSGRRGTRITISLGKTAEAKLALVRLYHSQFDVLPENYARFSPSIPGSGAGPHEAVWDFGLERIQRTGIDAQTTATRLSKQE